MVTFREVGVVGNSCLAWELPFGLCLEIALQCVSMFLITSGIDRQPEAFTCPELHYPVSCWGSNFLNHLYIMDSRNVFKPKEIQLNITALNQGYLKEFWILPAKLLAKMRFGDFDIPKLFLIFKKINFDNSVLS